MKFFNTNNKQANQTKSHWLLALSLSLMLSAQTAHADFRKALEAYQNRDGATMLKEVKDAVDKKNDDGLILFLSCLERDGVYSQNSMFVLNDEPIERRNMVEKTMGQYYKYDIPWIKMLSQGKTQEFLAVLQKASEQSSLEAQFRLINLRSPYGLFNILNYDEITKIEIKKRIDSNIYHKQFPELANKGYNEILYFLTEFGFSSKEEKEMRQQKLLASKSTRGLLLQAANKLTENTSKQTEEVGLQLLKSALTKPDASYFYADISPQMSAYYLKKGDKESVNQAYLWALVELTFGVPNYNRENEKPIKSLSKFKQAGGFQKLGLLTLDATWNKNSPNKNWDYQTLPSELKELKEIEWPDLITKNQSINLKQQPVLSFHRFNYDSQIIPFGLSVNNYLIDVYADGRVNFTVGNRFDRTQNKETLLTLNPKELEQLLTEFDQLDIGNIPLNTLTKKNCGMGGCSEDHSRMGGNSSTYYVTRRNQSNQRTVSYYLLDIVEDLPTFPAKVFALLESRLHTQQYRCGSVKERAYYKLCVDFDRKTIATASKINGVRLD